jgi:hypothetical protein
LSFLQPPVVAKAKKEALELQVGKSILKKEVFNSTQITKNKKLHRV